MAVTQQQFATVEDSIAKVHEIEESTRKIVRLLASVKNRVDPEDFLNKDVVWADVVTAYTPLYVTAKEELQALCQALP